MSAVLAPAGGRGEAHATAFLTMERAVEREGSEEGRRTSPESPPSEDRRLVGGALAAFVGCVLLTWTVGGYLQLRLGLGGWLLTELLCFALPAGWVLRRARVSASAAGFGRAPLPGMGWSVLLGLVVMAVAVGKGAMIRQALGVPPPPALRVTWEWVGLAVLAPLCEELLFRSVLQRAFSRIWRPPTALVATAVLFGLVPGSFVRFPEVFLLGFFSGVVFLKTRSYWASVAFHAAAALAAPAFWVQVTRWPALHHPLTTWTFLGVALVLAWYLDPPGAHRVWGVWRSARWALFGSAEPGAAPTRAGLGPVVAYGGVVMLLLGVMVTMMLIGAAGARLAQAPMRVRQADLWQLRTNGVIAAQSRIDFERWPARRESLGFALPYTGARVLRAEIAGQPARVMPVGAGTFKLVWPATPPAAPRAVHVWWELSLSELDDPTQGYRARLQALVPVTAYSLRLGLDPDCGYEFERAPELRQAEVFSIRDTGRAARNDFASCGLGLRRVAAGGEGGRR
ncbi:MAG: CPBP family intramembrane metalloprotease [Verrucomicrobiales bacterium]|nr:CPBP family intramembrane metalloprotease [Verrucomicrobiales bacterium]